MLLARVYISIVHKQKILSLDTADGTIIPTIKIFQMQYSEKKYPKQLKYFPWKVLDHSIFSLIVRASCASRNS